MLPSQSMAAWVEWVALEPPGAWPFSTVDPTSSVVARKAESCSLPMVRRAASFR
jgi:hypothetical protein